MSQSAIRSVIHGLGLFLSSSSVSAQSIGLLGQKSLWTLTISDFPVLDRYLYCVRIRGLMPIYQIYHAMYALRVSPASIYKMSRNVIITITIMNVILTLSALVSEPLASCTFLL